MTQTLKEKIVDVIGNNCQGEWPSVFDQADAILSVIAESVTDLKWYDWKSGHRTNSIAETQFGVYSVLHMFFSDEHWRWTSPNGDMGRGNTIQAAKAAAQADYTRRILSGIGLSTPEQEKGE